MDWPARRNRIKGIQRIQWITHAPLARAVGRIGIFTDMVREGGVVVMGHPFALPLLGKDSQDLMGPERLSFPLGRNERGKQRMASSKVRTLNNSLDSRSEEHGNRGI